MPSRRDQFPAIPKDTLQAASSLYGRGNIYLRLGDHLEELLLGLIPPDKKPCIKESKSFETSLQYGMLTVFQFVEELANQQMIDAVRNRVELKYALHLPMDNPSLDPDALCEIRQQLFANSANQHILQILLDRLVGFGLIKSTQDKPVGAHQLLETVCILNQLDEILKAMHRGLEAAAVTDPDWLRAITLPHWYERYKRGRRPPPILYSKEKWNARSLQIAADMEYFLGEIDKSLSPALASLKEIREIRRIWKAQSIASVEEDGNPQVIQCWPSKCANCCMRPDAQEV